MKITKTIFGLSVALAVASGWALSSCAPTPTNVALRTFERAQKMDFVCMQTHDASNLEIPATPVTLDNCSPVAPNTDGTTNQFHLFALVTQSTRGEIAVVDLTSAKVIDQNREVPGYNFLPVGELPVDVASTPDGTMSFVSTADPFKPAVYALPSDRILGDSQNVPSPNPPNTLASWAVCLLPQKGGPITVVPRKDGYDVAVTLPGDAANSAKVVLIDGKVFKDPTKTPPGQLAPCPISASIELRDAAPAAWSPGVPWPDGVPYATVDTTKDADGGSLLPRVNSACTDVRIPNADAGPDGAPAFGINPLRGSHAHASWSVLDGDFLLVADDGLPIIHVIDLSVANSLTEIEPYVATSLLNPERLVAVSQIAVSPRTRDLKRYMYALDQKQGTVLVYDVTDPRTGSKTPLLRPHPELNPFQPPDRIAFGSPIASLAFARHDFPLTQIGTVPLVASRSGLLCNPNPSVVTANLSSASSDQELGALYRAGESGGGLSLYSTTSTARLRGISGMLTTADGKIFIVDVDDWDAPCRRPAVLDGHGPGALSAAQTSMPSDPWSAPSSIGSTNEGYFPVSLPNSVRSNVFLTNDPTKGQNLPAFIGTPQLFLATKPISPAEAQSLGYSSLNPVLSFDEPTVSLDQDWNVVYEGSIPGFDGLAPTLDTQDGWKSLTFTLASGAFCAKGVHDLRVGQRVVAALQADVTATPTLSMPLRASERIADYVQITDDLLPPGDSYWTLSGGNSPDCWNLPNNVSIPPGSARYNACVSNFGTAQTQTLARDFPILEAYDDHLVTGRFLYPPTNASIQTRVIAPRDSDGEATLKLAQCCFHKQAKLRVRTGGQWVAIGTGAGYLHHIKPDPDTNACVLGCDERTSLMNARATDLVSAMQLPLDRNSAFVIRNPLITLQVIGTKPANGLFTNNQRDLTLKISTRGHFQSQFVNLSPSGAAVSPQSMRYVEPLGQMGIVDGSSLGLVLIDLNSLVISKNYN
jgi:hypothetical protein